MMISTTDWVSLTLSGDMDTLAHDVSRWRERKGFYTPSGIDNTIVQAVDLTWADAMLGKLCLVHDEMTELYKAYPDLHEMEQELADIAIRLLDIFGSCRGMTRDFVAGLNALVVEEPRDRTFSGLVLHGHGAVRRMTQGVKHGNESEFVYGGVALWHTLVIIADLWSFDLPGQIARTMEKNEARPVRHDKKTVL